MVKTMDEIGKIVTSLSSKYSPLIEEVSLVVSQKGKNSKFKTFTLYKLKNVFFIKGIFMEDHITKRPEKNATL